MTNVDFVHYRARLLKEANKVSDRKVKDYAHDEDRLMNFKRNAIALGAEPEFILAVYMNKHMDSIQRIIGDLEDGRTLYDIESETSELTEGRLVDAINYLILLGALLEERRGPE